MFHDKLFTAGRWLIASALMVLPAAAQSEAPRYAVHAFQLDSGVVANSGSVAEVVFSKEVRIDGAAWLRLMFREVTLAGDPFASTGSTLRLTSLWDGAVQELNSIHVEQWRRSSCYLNGDSVLVEIFAQPGTGANRVVLSEAWAGDAPVDDSQCGPTDDRVLSSDPRAGRLLPIGCTGWIINDCNSCMLTAGHCTGNLAVLQFNVPMSNSSGGLVNPPPEDQYAIDAASILSNGGQGTGNDWGYFGCFPNPNTGQTPFQRQGARFTLTAPPPFNGSETIRITGYGTDSTPNATFNQVQQTHVGPWRTFSGNLVQYETDTTGGNSGSPVIHEQTGNAIGIHTHGGCGTGNPPGQNSGTASVHPGLQAALANPAGVCAGALASLSLPNGAPSLVAPGVAAPVDVVIVGSIQPGSAALRYRTAPGAFASAPLTDLGGGLFRGFLPVASCGMTLDFYLEAQSLSCGPVANPTGAPATFFTAQVGNQVVAVDDDFETDQGWVATNLGATSGDWQRGIPVNDPNWAYDPAADGDGSGRCWLTQNATGNTDVDGGAVRLASPPLDMSIANARLSYAYYLTLTVTDGVDRLLVEASNNGGASWVTVATHTTDGNLGWRTNTITAAQFAAAGAPTNASMLLRFTANDGGTASIVEAGIDAIRVDAQSCGPLGVNVCVSGPLGSVISASGSTSLAANDLALQADHVPSNKNGLFIHSASPNNVPLGPATLCVAGSSPLFRLPGVNSGAGTTLNFALDYGALNGGATILPGQTRYFQAWFRTSPGQFDLSDAVQLTFVP